MLTKFTGRVWKFGDNVDTDAIVPGKYLTLIEEKDLARHLMEGADPEFSKKVRRGDIIVGGRNFGCGSSREHAPVAIRGAGVPVVVAESFARIFYRNSINIGLPLVECPGVGSLVKEGETLTVNLSTGEVSAPAAGKHLKAASLPPFILSILEAGGLAERVRKELSNVE